MWAAGEVFRASVIVSAQCYSIQIIFVVINSYASKQFANDKDFKVFKKRQKELVPIELSL